MASCTSPPECNIRCDSICGAPPSDVAGSSATFQKLHVQCLSATAQSAETSGVTPGTNLQLQFTDTTLIPDGTWLLDPPNPLELLTFDTPPMYAPATLGDAFNVYIINNGLNTLQVTAANPLVIGVGVALPANVGPGTSLTLRGVVTQVDVGTQQATEVTVYIVV